MGVPSGYTSGQVVQAVPTGINSALVLISTTTIGTTVSSVTVSSAFSATYDAYKITVTGGAASTGNSLLMTLGATTTGYSLQIVYGAFNNTPLALGTSNTSSWNAGNGNTNSLSMNIDLLNPFLTEQTFINGALIENGAGGALAGFLNNTTSYTAFTLTTSGGTITGGTIRVYGYTNS